jgi:hypothetical protein
MSTADLYIDVVRGEFVANRTNSSIASLPPLVRGTTQNFRVMLLNPTGEATGPNVYTPLAVAGQTIQMAIGIFGGASYLTSQFSWTGGTDLANPFFSASLSLNTANITSAIGSSKTLACSIQIDRVESGIPTNVILKDVIIKNAIIVPGTEISAPGRTLLYAETAATLFLTRTITGRVRFINDTDATKMNELFTDTDGSFQEQPVS